LRGLKQSFSLFLKKKINKKLWDAPLCSPHILDIVILLIKHPKKKKKKRRRRRRRKEEENQKNQRNQILNPRA
jgi:hypothetical protein